MDSLKGTREAGKDHLDSLKAPGRQERTPARHREARKDQLDGLRGTGRQGRTI